MSAFEQSRLFAPLELEKPPIGPPWGTVGHLGKGVPERISYRTRASIG